MEKPAIIFSFCPEDQHLVDPISDKLKIAPLDFIQNIRQEGHLNSIARTIQLNPETPVFLLVSDRFLKSEISMDRAWEFISETVSQDQLHLVIKKEGETSSLFGGQEIWSNDFIAYYKHFWDETYGNLRKRRDQIAPGELETYNWRVRVVRKINDTVSEFISQLQNFKSVSLKDFQANDFQYIFELLNLKNSQTLTEATFKEENLEKPVEANPIIPKIENPEKAYLDFLESGVQEDETVQELNGSPDSMEDEKKPPEKTPITLKKIKKKKKKQTLVALITGATSGIGEAVAKRFALDGYQLILTGRREKRLEKLQKILKKKFKTKSKILHFDIRDHEAVVDAIASLKNKWTDIDLLVNNAGLAKGFDPIHEGNLDHWETMIDTNIKGLLYITRIIAKNMVERGKGHIINVGSIAGKEVYPNGNVYCASKHAVDALTKAMRIDLYKHGIKVSSVSPGHVETEFALVRFDGDVDKAMVYEDFQPLTAKDIAETIYFIATRPKHVNVQDVVIFSSQQASANHINRSGR